MADADVSVHSKTNTEYESEHALRGRCDCDLFLDCDLESLRIRRGRNGSRQGANRMPIPFQASEAKGTILAGTVLQNPARCCPRENKRLGT